MASRKKQGRPRGLGSDDQSAVREVLGHLNFSGGKREPAFLARLNRLWRLALDTNKAAGLAELLRTELAALAGGSPAFADCTQAQAVIGLALEQTLTAYRAHHADLLFHLDPAEYEQPFMFGCLFEAVLAQGGPWEETERVVDGAIAQLNDYVGYRPIAVLENGRQMELYPHERFRPLPIYIAGAGTAAGRYHDLVARTMAFLDEAPADLLEESHFHRAQLDEIAIDLRAHDHLHPVNKRTNYMFGEWDPHCIDVKGNYRRFIVRKIILDALADWVEQGKGPREERLFDAAAALCGTMLMASSISGSGPETHNSTVSLTSLLPVVARRRDAFYARLMEQVAGARAKRLQREERKTQQPFGHVRQHLNMQLAQYGARQVQHRELAYLYARMGYVDAAREQAAAIPAASIRFECELQSRSAGALLQLRQGKLAEAAAQIQELEGILQRGIECGAIADPWNFLGFQGQFPLFASREDTIPDNRIETLLELMEGTFVAFARGLAESAAQGNAELQERLSAQFQRLAQWWDRFGSDVIEDLPDVPGEESWEAAVNVAHALAQWRSAGAAAGDISFWRQHVERFASAQAYAQVVEALLEKRDHVAALGLLMQWLSQIEEVGFESNAESIFSLLIRWMRLVTAGKPDADGGRAAVICRMFDYLEANAEEFWSVPRLDSARRRPGRAADATPESLEPEAAGADEDDEDDVFGAAYEGVVYKDSADDGTWGDTLEDEQGFRNTEFEVINRELEPRLKFLNAVGQMWQMAACTLASQQVSQSDPGASALDSRTADAVAGWRSQLQAWDAGLLQFMHAVWEREIAAPAGDHDANVEYDLQTQVKFYLLNQIIMTLVCLRNARRLLSGLAAAEESDKADDDEQLVARIYAAVLRRDTPAVRQQLPALFKWLERQPLLYVPFDHGGRPDPLLRTQSVQSVFRFLLRQFPALGLLREGWHVLQAAFRMERRLRPEGQAITEFDRLFHISLRSSLETLLNSARRWRNGRFNHDELIDMVSELVDPYQSLWLKHSSTMRLSSVDAIRTSDDLTELSAFIHLYGAELFHASQLTLGNVRAILQNGVDWFLGYLEENEDPLRPMRLLADLRSGKIDRDDAQWCLETIYSVVVDRFDRFLDYNTTTTQSDYGEMFFCLLDFLRIEARYDRDAWNMLPLTIVHEMLARHGRDEAADAWSATFEMQTADLAAQHLAELSLLEKRHGMHIPTVRDHLNERFIKPLAVNRMVALVGPSVRDAVAGRRSSRSFRRLNTEITRYLADSFGSGVDVPGWLRTLEHEVEEVTRPSDGGRPGMEAPLELPAVSLSLRDFRLQLRSWREPLTPSSARRTGPQPRRPGRKSSKPKGDPRKEGEA